MITRKTVFVLGAGVSVPFGFPSGKELLHILTGDTFAGNDEWSKRLRQSHLRLVEFMERLQGRGYMEQLISDLKKSMTPSVDTWLAYHPSHNHIAKQAIAAVIYEHESICKSHAYADDDWFSWIFDRMLRNARTLEDFLANNVTFVTFNYDRLLEWKLAQALEGFFGETRRDAIPNAIEQMCKRILHIHGSLNYTLAQGSHLNSVFGDINFSGAPGLNSPAAAITHCGRHIDYATQSILIIGEERQDKTTLEASIDVLKKADQVIFLGFGYDERNLEVLRLNEWVHGKASTSLSGYSSVNSIVGSAFGLRTAQRRTILKAFSEQIGLGDSGLSNVPFCNEDVYLG